jgi:hypothetical protein
MIRIILTASLLSLLGAGAYKLNKATPAPKATQTASCCIPPPCPPECPRWPN